VKGFDLQELEISILIIEISKTYKLD